jgi:soluble lytic murein transglycosylase-like protein
MRVCKLQLIPLLLVPSLALAAPARASRKGSANGIVAVRENGHVVYTNFGEVNASTKPRPQAAQRRSRVAEHHSAVRRHSSSTHAVKAAARPRVTPGVAWHPERRDRVLQLLDSAAERYRVDPLLVRELAREESNFDNLCVSDKGALGVMQLMPETARDLGVSNPFDAEQNINGGTRYLRYLLRRYHGNVKLTLAAYNAGEGAVARYGSVPPYPETRAYVRSITRRYNAGRSGNGYAAGAGRPVRRSIIFSRRDERGHVVFTDNQ